MMSIPSFGQSFSVVSLENLPMDLTGSTQSRTDLNGKKCGLIKVQCVLDDVNFAGNIIGNIEHKDGEYWVYITEGSKQLSVRHPKLLPLDVEFKTSLHDGIRSSSTYRLTLSIPGEIYSSILTRRVDAPVVPNKQSNIVAPLNTTLSGIVTDRKDGEPLIGCTVLCKNTNMGIAGDIDGHFTLDNVKPGSTIEVSYIGYKRKQITFTGKIPPHIDISLKTGRGIEKEEYFYDPNDTAEYFDLSGKKLPQRPSKKGTYIRLSDGKAERISIN